MKKTTKRLAKILGIQDHALDDILRDAQHPLYTQKQIDAIIGKLEEYGPFSRINITGYARAAGDSAAPRFWHRVARQTKDITLVNLLDIARSAKPPKRAVEHTVRMLGRRLTNTEETEWADEYRQTLFSNSRHAYDKKCDLCGTVDTVEPCRVCGMLFCDKCDGSELNSNVACLVCKCCVEKLPRGWCW